MSFSNISLSPFLKKIVGTVFTSVLTIVCLVIATSYLAKGLGPEQFGVFSLIRRLLNTLEPWVTVSMGISVARYLALTEDSKQKLAYLRAGFVVQIAALALTVGIGLLFPTHFAELIFQDGTKYTAAFIAFLFLVSTYSFFVLLYAYYRGLGDMLTANIWQTAVIAVGPMIVALLLAKPENLNLIVYLNAMLLAASIVPLFWHLKPLNIGATAGKLKSAIRELLRYGLPRVPGTLIYGGILALGPLGASHLGNLKEAGYLVIGQSILKIYEGGIEGFSRAALPTISAHFSKFGKESLQKHVSQLISFIWDSGLYLTLRSYLWMGPILILWLGPEYEPAILPVKVMVVSLCPYLAYVTLRTVLDAVEERALTTRFLFIALLSMVLSCALLVALGSGPIGFAWGTAISFFVLGGLSVIRICQDFDIRLRSLLDARMLLLNIVLAVGGGWVGWPLMEKTSNTIEKILVLFLVEGVCILIYLYGISRFKLGWYQSLVARVFSRGTDARRD